VRSHVVRWENCMRRVKRQQGVLITRQKVPSFAAAAHPAPPIFGGKHAMCEAMSPRRTQVSLMAAIRRFADISRRNMVRKWVWFGQSLLPSPYTGRLPKAWGRGCVLDVSLIHHQNGVGFGKQPEHPKNFGLLGDIFLEGFGQKAVTARYRYLFNKSHCRGAIRAINTAVYCAAADGTRKISDGRPFRCR
jgi:hypothetical protein